MIKILLPVLRYDYGIKSRGPSLESEVVVPALARSAEIVPFWLEDFGFPSDLDGLQDAVLKKAEEVNPDLIFFILMRDEIRIATLDALAKRWATCNWFADDQWRFFDFSRNLASHLWQCITVDRFSLAKYFDAGFSNVILSQWAANPTPVSPSGNQLQYEVSFVGGRNITRAWVAHRLRKQGIDISCFGSGWPNGRVSAKEMAQIAQNSKICLNLSNSVTPSLALFFFALRELASAIAEFLVARPGSVRKLRRVLRDLTEITTSQKRVEQVKARNFEIPAWGGFQVSQFALGLEEYFVPGKEIILYSRFDELVTVLRYYLKMDLEREAIRSAGVVRAKTYTWDRVMSRLVLEIEARLQRRSLERTDS